MAEVFGLLCCACLYQQKHQKSNFIHQPSYYVDAVIGALDFFVGGEVADVVTAAGHLHGMDGNLMAEPGDVAAGGIGAATGGDALGYEVGIGSGIVVEGRAGPVGSWGGGLLGHLGDEVVVIDGDDTALQETFC